MAVASTVVRLSTRASPVKWMSGLSESAKSTCTFAVALNEPLLITILAVGARYASKGPSAIFDAVSARSPCLCQIFTAPCAANVPEFCQVNAARTRELVDASLAMESTAAESPVIAKCAGRPAAESVTFTAKLSSATRPTDQRHAGAGFAAVAGAAGAERG